MRGYTEIFFFPTHALAEYHAGEFRDRVHNDICFYAKRLPLTWGMRTTEEKKQAALDVWEILQPQMDRMLSNPISADWR